MIFLSFDTIQRQAQYQRWVKHVMSIPLPKLPADFDLYKVIGAQPMQGPVGAMQKLRNGAK